jgi:polyisoprenyl-teichoic acid--peptidoglycan teichoic acid transferase
MSRDRRTWPQRGLLALNVVLIVACVGLALVLRDGVTRAESINRMELSAVLSAVEDQDEGRAVNVLLVGKDSSEGLDPDDPIQTGREGERNSDVIIVAHLDERSDTAALLSFPRDLWVPIAGTGSEAKINAAFGVGGARSLIGTIEERFGIPIHHYVQVDFAGFQGLVEAVGSVPVWFDSPARDWNASAGITQTGFEVTEAGCVELDPVDSLAYVRSRYYQTYHDGQWVTDRRSDLGRIERQQDFLRRLLARAVDQGARNPFTLRQLIDVGLERVTVDQQLTPQDLLDLGRRFSGFDPDDLGTYTVPVQFGTVGTASVLFAQDEVLEPVLEVFRGAAADDPATVRVKLQYEAVEGSQVTDLRDRLTEAGYEVAGAASAPVAPGIAIRYAPGTRAAAARLVEVVWPDAVLVLDETLPGRDVVVALGGAGAAAGNGPGPGDEADPAGGADPDEGGPAPVGGPGTEPPGPPTGDDGGADRLDPARACR